MIDYNPKGIEKKGQDIGEKEVPSMFPWISQSLSSML